MILYLDTSSLVKLYVEEEGSDAVGELAAAADVVATSLIAWPEAWSAFARQRREGGLTAAAHRRVRDAFEEDWQHLLRMEVTEELCREAGHLAEVYALRGFDSIHLASFVELAGSANEPVRFSGFDERLQRAAEAVLE